MIGWLWRVIVGRFRAEPRCAHQWEIHATVTLHDDHTSKRLPVGYCYVLRCKLCGDMMQRKVLH